MSNSDFINALEILSTGCKNAKEVKKKIKSGKVVSDEISPKFTPRIEQQLNKNNKNCKRKCEKIREEIPFAHLTGQQRVDEIRHFLRTKKIKTWGENLPEPILYFDSLLKKPYELNKNFIDSLSERKIDSLLPIQMMVIPTLLQGFDILASAPTGSGKTISFLLPLLHHVFALKTKNITLLRGLIIAPTKELANQIHHEAELLMQPFLSNPLNEDHLIIRCLTKHSEKETLRLEAQTQGRKYAFVEADILITTPRRFIWMIHRKKPLVNLQNLQWLILDECDKLFGIDLMKQQKSHKTKQNQEEVDKQNTSTDSCMMMDKQLDTILSACYKATASQFHLALFSATSHPPIKQWARKTFKKPAFLQVGVENTAVSSVEQFLKYCTDDAGKEWEVKYLLSPGSKGALKPRQYPVLIFVKTKKRAFLLKSELVLSGIMTDVISADRSELEREKIVERFRDGHLPTLICTELMARGMDFPLVGTVINYDLPSSPVEYIHRVGRTGRGVGPQSQGIAYTFWTEKDKKEVIERKKTASDNSSSAQHGQSSGSLLGIMNVMVQSGVPVNEELLTFLKTHRNGKKRKVYNQSNRKQDKRSRNE